MLYDSRVICEYLNVLGGGALFPAEGKPRWQALTEQSLGDGMLGAALLARYETVLRPEALRWDGWYEGQMGKVRDGRRCWNRTPPRWRSAWTSAPSPSAARWATGLPLSRLRLARRLPRRGRVVRRVQPAPVHAGHAAARLSATLRFWGGQRGLGIPAGPRAGRPRYGAYRAAAGPLAQARAFANALASAALRNCAMLRNATSGQPLQKDPFR